AGRAFGDGLRAYYGGQYGAAESHFRKAITFSPDDARYHYLLGLTLWVTDDKKGAEAEFEKGRDLELAGRPAPRLISSLLERVQGPARQAVNAYRPGEEPRAGWAPRGPTQQLHDHALAQPT